MTPEQLGRTSLALDAVTVPPPDSSRSSRGGRSRGSLGVPTAVTAGSAIATFGWAVLVANRARGRRWRTAVAGVAAATVAASSVLVGLALAHTRTPARLVLAGTGIEVAAFASSQVVALRRSAE